MKVVYCDEGFWVDTDKLEEIDGEMVAPEICEDDINEEIDRLRAELAEKDKHIEELLEAEIESIVGVFRNGHLVTYKQIDAAWGQKYFYDGVDGPLIRANLVNIVACEKCGGSGSYTGTDEDHDRPVQRLCKACHGHGWIITSVDVDKYGRIGT